MGVGQLSESDAVDALRLPFYSSSHPTGSHGWRNQFDLGNPESNIFVDFGLYDVRTPNNVIPNPDWADLFARDKEWGHFGVCFFDYLPAAHGEILRSLPTGIEGKTSDYCR